MLLETFNDQGLLLITSVIGETTETGKFAFRGDLVLKEGELREGSDRDRKPPEFVIHQAVVLSSEQSMIFVSGLFYELDQIEKFVAKYKEALTPETVLMFYVENIDAKMKLAYEGLTFQLLPYTEGMIWNELLDTLYLEKSDLKGQSAEDKVMTVFDAAKDFDVKTDALTLAAALEKTIIVDKELSTGPV